MVTTKFFDLPLVLLPGFMLDDTLWDDMIACLNTTAPVYRLPLAPGSTVEEIARSIGREAPNRFILVGFSLGGYIARKVAELFPERVAALILVATSLRADTKKSTKIRRDAVTAMDSTRFRGLSSSAISKSLHPERRIDKVLVGRIQAMGTRIGYQGLVAQTNLQREHIAAATLKCPSLILGALQDELRSQEEVKELAAEIPASSLVFVNDSGHMIPLEQPERLAAEIGTWIHSLDALFSG